MLYGNISRIILFVINRFSHKLNCFTLQEIISSRVKNVGDKVVSRQLAEVTPWKGFGARLSEGFLLLIKPGEESQLSAWECFSWWHKIWVIFLQVSLPPGQQHHTLQRSFQPVYLPIKFFISFAQKKRRNCGKALKKKKTRGTLV